MAVICTNAFKRHFRLVFNKRPKIYKPEKAYGTLLTKRHILSSITKYSTKNFCNSASHKYFAITKQEKAMGALSPLDPSSFSRPEIAIIRHVSLVLDVDFENKVLAGIADLNFDILHATDEIILDVNNLTIQSVELKDGTQLKYNIDEHIPNFGSKLSVTLPNSLPAGQNTVKIIQIKESAAECCRDDVNLEKSVSSFILDFVDDVYKPRMIKEYRDDMLYNPNRSKHKVDIYNPKMSERNRDVCNPKENKHKPNKSEHKCDVCDPGMSKYRVDVYNPTMRKHKCEICDPDARKYNVDVHNPTISKQKVEEYNPKRDFKINPDKTERKREICDHDVKKHKIDVCKPTISKHKIEEFTFDESDDNIDHKCEICDPDIRKHKVDVYKPTMSKHKIEEYTPNESEHKIISDECGYKCDEYVPDVRKHKVDVCDPTISQHKIEEYTPDESEHKIISDECGYKSDEYVPGVGKHKVGVCDPKISQHKIEEYTPDESEHKIISDECGYKCDEYDPDVRKHKVDVCGPKISQHKIEEYTLDKREHKIDKINPGNIEHKCDKCDPDMRKHKADNDPTMCKHRIEEYNPDKTERKCDMCGRDISTYKKNETYKPNLTKYKNNDSENETCKSNEDISKPCISKDKDICKSYTRKHEEDICKPYFSKTKNAASKTSLSKQIDDFPYTSENEDDTSSFKIRNRICTPYTSSHKDICKPYLSTQKQDQHKPYINTQKDDISKSHTSTQKDDICKSHISTQKDDICKPYMKNVRRENTCKPHMSKNKDDICKPYLSITNRKAKGKKDLDFEEDVCHMRVGGYSRDDSEPWEHNRLILRIKYRTSPSASALQWLEPNQTSGKKHPYMFSQCQPIHARSILPCQDTPAVKFTYDAEVTAPEEFTVLMSAIRGENRSKRTMFQQSVPIPSYLLAIAVGVLEHRRLGPRSLVWSEKEEIERSAWEFAETEKYLEAAENLCGPYQWGQYDLLVLPPSFPYGGMENPCLTFVTPTLLAGDRSQADVIVHEIMHSWTGNLVTNRNFEHFWLNEGFTVFLERKVGASLIADPAEAKRSRDFHSLLGLQELSETINDHFGPSSPLTRLVPDLDGVHPDDAFSRVPYEKGSLFLRYLEDLVGGPEVFDEFLRSYLGEFQKRSLDTDQFKDYLLNYFSGNNNLSYVDWDTWFYSSGMPPIIPNYDTSMTKAVTALVTKITEQSDFSYDDVKLFTPHQMINLLQELIDRDALPIQKLRNLGNVYKVNASKNSEIIYRWLRLCIRSRDITRLDDVLNFVNQQGRMKYVRPIYRDLYAWEDVRQQAIDNFLKNEPYMMHVSAYTLRKDLHLSE